jgi:hypothetical protein
MLNEILLELANYGKPSIFQFDHNKKWYCRVNVYVSMKGVDFEVKSESCNSPIDAATECLEKTKEAVGQVLEISKNLGIRHGTN